MSLVLRWVNEPTAYRLGWVLVHSLWQGAIAALVFGLLRVGLRGRSAEARYLTGCILLAILAAAPVVTFFYESPGSSTAPGSDSSLPWTGFGRSQQGVNRSPATFDSTLLLDFAAWNRFVNAWLPWIVLLWLVGICICSCRWVQGYWWVRRRRCAGIGPVDPQWLELLERVKTRLGIERRVQLVTSSLAEVPMVIGWLKPIILLPASSLTGLSPAQLEAILAHELAHVRRCDYLVNTFQNLVETFMFYHPAVWWISRCIRQEREHCCDDMVVGVLHDRLGYARALYQLEQLRGTAPRVGFAASGGSLLTRIRRLLSGNPGPITAKESCGLALAGLGVLLLLAGGSLLLGPRTYCSTVRIKVEHSFTIPAAGMDGQQPDFVSDPWFVQTEFEVIRSEVILGKVIEGLNLDKEWSPKFGRVLKGPESIALLRREMDVRPVGKTSIIELSIYDENPTRAAEIANHIADTYRDWRRNEGSRQGGDRLDSLVTQVKAQDAAVDAAQAKVDALRAQGILAGTPDVPNRSETLISAETLRRIEGLRLESQAEYVRSKALLESLSSLNPDQLVEAIPTTGIPDQLLADLLTQRVAARQRLAALQADYGPEHSEVRRVSNQIDELNAKVTERTRGFLAGLSARVDSLAQGLNDLSNEVAKATQQDIEHYAKSREHEAAYTRAQRELDDQMEIRKMLVLKLASAKTEQPTPKTSVVEIVDRAFPSSWPATPNRPRAFGLMAGGAILATLGLLLARTRRADASMASAGPIE